MTKILSGRMKGTNGFAIGVDIEDIGRFLELDIANDRIFLGSIFTKNELDYCFSKKNPAPHLAARFVGKEAIFKALSSIGKSNIDYKWVEIHNNEKGVPMVKINNKDFNNLEIHLSLSHSRDKAIAFAAIREVNYSE